VLETFTSADKSLEALINKRVDDYTAAYQSKDAMFDPANMLLDQLKVIADSSTVNRSNALVFYGAFARATDWPMLLEMQSLYLFLRCFKALFGATNDLSELTAEQMKNLLVSAIRNASPVDFTPKEPKEEPALAGG
jgi:hypothetical protein